MLSIEDQKRMTRRQIAEYLAKQEAQGWPGSTSITGRAINSKKSDARK